MKFFLILFLILNGVIAAQQAGLKGRVIDAETKSPLPGANVVLIDEQTTGAATDSNGEFSFEDEYSSSARLLISYVGYETRKISLDDLTSIPSVVSKSGERVYLFYLTTKIIPSQTVLIEASVGTKGITPIAFDQIKQKQIEENYTVFDIPKYLSDLPSTTFYSESGNAIGYNYLSIRGFDQRRISVSINGIPQNDPEDNNVYWLDFPDLLSSTGLIQVQRGAGSGVFGYPAIGGSINIITSSFSNRPKVELKASYGS